MRLSDLLRRRIETESGRRLGHVHDVRAEIRGDRLLITGLLVGQRAFFEHFGLGIGGGTQGTKVRTAAEVVPWDAVVRMSPGKVIVRDGTETTTRPTARRR